MNRNNAPGEDGMSDILQRMYDLLPKSTTGMYNGCLREACFPKIWKTAKLIPTVKPGQETCKDMTKYRLISLLNSHGAGESTHQQDTVLYHV